MNGQGKCLFTGAAAINTLKPLKCDVAIVGAGIAGCWTAIKLLRLGIKTTVIYYDLTDRGGKLGSSNLSVGAINTSPLLRPDYLEWLDELGRGQGNLDVGNITRNNLASELDQLLEFDPLKNIALGVALKSGSGRLLLKRLIQEIRLLGGRVLDHAWVTRIVVDNNLCQGLQYQSQSAIGAVYARFVVLASGGYASLFQGSVKTGSYGSIHGRLLMAGGTLSNMEFVFKHGYGQPDLGVLTPTEELPGAEIYDEQGRHEQWLEKELFLGRGTHNHFQAFMTWRKDKELKFFVDFRYRDLHLDLKRLISNGGKAGADGQGDNKDALFNKLVDRCRPQYRAQLSVLLTAIREQPSSYNYDTFNRIKELVCDQYPVRRSRIRQISYFSMGGIAHHKFSTNLENVFVCGEAMHDYGAFRVGGLPWALYLCAAKVISQRIDFLKRLGFISISPFDLHMQNSAFDTTLLQALQSGLQQYQENGLNVKRATAFADWIRIRRLTLIDQRRYLDDAVAYLTTGEAIMRSSLARGESRGCFFRDDFSEENAELADQYTLASYNHKTHNIEVNLVNRAAIARVLRFKHKYDGDKSMNNVSETNNAAHFLVKKHLLAGAGESSAIETLKVRYSYRDLWLAVNRYARLLKQSDIDEGDRVALLLNDRPDYVALFIAAQQIGAIAVPLNTFSKEHELLHYLGDSGAKLLISEKDLLAKYSVETIHEKTMTRVLDYREIPLHELPPLEDIAAVSEETPGFILYTSGSTGKPKGAIHRQSSMAKSAECFARNILSLNNNDRVFSSSKLFFAYGLGNSLYFPLYFGATSLLESAKANRETVSEILQTLKPTLYFSVPAAYNEILQCNGATPALFHSVRLCISAGEALPVNTAKSWYANTNIDIIDGLGSTEAGHIFCVSNHSGETGTHYGTAVPGYELKIVNDQHVPVAKNTIGEMFIKGPTLATAYWNAPEKTAQTFVNGGLITGDRFFANNQGEFVFVGRHSDTFKSSGLWVSTLEIEKVISELDFISESAVVVFQSNNGLLMAKAYLVANKGLTFEEKENIEMKTRGYLKAQLPKYKVPHSLEIIDALPRTATGKVAKTVLREMAQEVICNSVPAQA